MLFSIFYKFSKSIFYFTLSIALISYLQVIIDNQDISFLWKVDSEEGNVFFFFFF